MERVVDIRVRGGVSNLEFFAYDEELDVEVKSKNASEIPALMSAEFEKRFVQTWEVFVWVRVTSGNGDSHDEGRSLSFDFQPIAVGKNLSGEPVWKRISFEFPHEKRRREDEDAYAPRAWKGDWKNYGGWQSKVTNGEPESPYTGWRDEEKGKSSVLIPGTIQNVNALYKFADQVEQLAGVMRQLFDKKRVTKTLRYLAQGANLLPAHSEGKE